jgi:hypothetical protein
MSDCLSDETLQAWLDGELRREKADAVQLHVTTCASCAANAKSARQALSLADDGWEDALPMTIPEVQLRDRIDEAMAGTMETELPGRSNPALHWGLAAAAVVLAFGLMFLMRSSPQITSPSVPPEKVAPLPSDDSPPKAPVAVAANKPDSADRSTKQESLSREVPVRPARPAVRGNTARAETRRHLEQSQQLLHSIRNTEVETADWAYELQLSRKLLNRNRLLRRSAALKEDAMAERLLVHLEPILIDIANLTEQPVPDEIASIKALIQDQSIIPELRLYAARAGS